MNKKICVLMLVGIFVMMSFQSISAEVLKPDITVSADEEESPTDELYQICFMINTIVSEIFLDGIWYSNGDVAYIEPGTYYLKAAPMDQDLDFDYWTGIPSTYIDIEDRHAQFTYVTITGSGAIILMLDKNDVVKMMTTQSSPQQLDSTFLGSQSL